MESGDAALTVEPERIKEVADPLPEELSGRRMGRAALVLALVVVLVVVVVWNVPGLDALRDRFSGAKPGWLVLAALLQLGSCLSYVLVFRSVFCRLMAWRTSYEIGMAELATNSMVSVGGAGGLALGAWILRHGGMSAGHIARRTVAFFLLTSAANITLIVVVGIGLAAGILDGAETVLLGLIPAAMGLVAVAAALSIRPLGSKLADRVKSPRASAALQALSDGVGESLFLLRRGDVRIPIGSLGYVLFDVAMLGVCFAAFGLDVPPVGVLVMAYLIGQLGGLIPIPGGIGGVDGGLIGTLVVYGVSLPSATVAVLAYRALLLLIPPILGVPAMLVLKRKLRDEAHDIDACTPGDEIEVIGVGRVRAAAEA
jgi:uncharacterized membrane protein YbhN (UPF0104 family)